MPGVLEGVEHFCWFFSFGFSSQGAVYVEITMKVKISV